MADPEILPDFDAANEPPPVAPPLRLAERFSVSQETRQLLEHIPDPFGAPPRSPTALDRLGAWKVPTDPLESSRDEDEIGGCGCLLGTTVLRLDCSHIVCEDCVRHSRSRFRHEVGRDLNQLSCPHCRAAITLPVPAKTQDVHNVYTAKPFTPGMVHPFVIGTGTTLTGFGQTSHLPTMLEATHAQSRAPKRQSSERLEPSPATAEQANTVKHAQTQATVKRMKKAIEARARAQAGGTSQVDGGPHPSRQTPPQLPKRALSAAEVQRVADEIRRIRRPPP